MYNAGGNHPPSIPSGLVEALKTGQSALFFGPGMSSHFGLLNRYQLVRRLLKELPALADVASKLRPMLQERRAEAVAQVICSRVSQPEIVETVAKILGEHRATDTKPSWRAMSRLPFVSAVTTNYDSLLERLYRDRHPLILRGSPDDDILGAYDQARFVINKMYGDVKEANTFRFTADQYRGAMVLNEALVRIISSLLTTKSVLFLGSSITGIGEFFSVFPATDRWSGPPHYALLPHSDFAELQRERFLSLFGVELILFERDQDFTQVETFITALEEKTNPGLLQQPIVTHSQPKLEMVRLRNIGPFEELEVTFNDGWNLFIGNNAAGKSSLLRAIALGLCGDDPRAALSAQKILRIGEKQGSIELVVNGTTYKTEIVEDADRIRVISKQVSPLQRGSLIAIGFPPLRGIDVGRSATYHSQGRARPLVEDLLPLIQGGHDSRLSDLKSWLIFNDIQDNLKASGAKRESAPSGFPDSLNAKFFVILSDLLPDEEFSFDSADVANEQVFVKTIDGRVSIDQVSQGMMSILGWLGTLLERMYEVYTDSLSPNEEPALLLVDELDAHLHPEWQQRLIPLVKKHFPNTQVLATTHSPLLVAELRKEEIFISRRNENRKPVIDVARVDPSGLRSDQVLTSVLFGLVTTRGAHFAEQVEEYTELFGRSNLTQKESIRLTELKERLKETLLEGETETQRKNDRAMRKIMTEELRPDVLLSGIGKDQAAELRKRLLQDTPASFKNTATQNEGDRD